METNNKGRRPRAKPGMTSTELRAVIKQLVNAELKDAQALLDQCSLEKRAALLTKVGAIILPRQTAEEAKAERPDEGMTTGITMYLGEPDEEPIYIAPQKKEQTKKPGRRMGYPNKRTHETRERLEAIFISEYNYITNRFEELPADKRIDLLLKLALLTIPSQSAKDLSREEDYLEKEVTMILD